MVFTASQTTLFFESPDQMGLADATVVQLQKEGITTVSDLEDFGKYTIMQIAANPNFFFSCQVYRKTYCSHKFGEILPDGGKTPIGRKYGLEYNYEEFQTYLGGTHS